MGIVVAPRSASPSSPSLVDLAVLSLVIEDPSYGYEIWERFDGRFGALLPTAVPWTIYRSLKRLTAAGLLEASGERQCVYAATDAGARAHTKWIGEPPGQREMLVKITAATGLKTLGCALDAYELAYLDELEAVAAPLPSITLSGDAFRELRQLQAEAALTWVTRTRERLAPRRSPAAVA